MQVKRFVAADMRRALELVRQAMGPDAIILSSNRTAEGVELMTTLASDDELMQLQQAPRNVSAASPLARESASPGASSAFGNTGSSHRGLASGKTGQQLADEIEQARLRMIASRKAEESAKEFLVGKSSPRKPTPATEVTAQAPARPIQATPKTSPNVSAADRYPLHDEQPAPKKPQVAPKRPVAREENFQLSELQAELADMRFLLEQQLDRMTGVTAPAGSPVLSSISRRMERIGLPADVINTVLARCTKAGSLADAWPDALAGLAHQLPVCGKDVVEQGGIFAFVGPTGVGKTTTIGKLAARYVLAHGADKVALVTTDTYRIAAHDQLRSFGRILRVPVKVVDENNPLDEVLSGLRNYPLVLIDTAGFRHGDPHLKAQLKALAGQPQIKSYLVLSCNSQQQMLKASIHAYGAAGIKGCVLTKLDETASLGEALGVVMQSRLAIAYTTDGQDIPKDIQVARGHQLVSKAAALLKHNPANSPARQAVTAQRPGTPRQAAPVRQAGNVRRDNPAR